MSHHTSPPYAGTGTKFDYNEPKEPDEDNLVEWEPEVVEVPPAHRRRKFLDPRVHGPFLDEIHREEMVVALEVADERRDAAE